MATVFDSVSIEGLRITHFEQLLSYIDNNDTYYGNRAQFSKRHKELRAWVVGILDQAKKEGIIIPKKSKEPHNGSELVGGFQAYADDGTDLRDFGDL